MQGSFKISSITLKDTEFEPYWGRCRKIKWRDKKPEESNKEDGESDGWTKTKQDNKKSNTELEEIEELEDKVSSTEVVGKHAHMEPQPVCQFWAEANCIQDKNCRYDINS